MPRNETILQVFVASPGDLGEERDALEEVITELNNTWSRNLRIRLELIRWETHSIPGVGSDPQDVINQTTSNDYDIFIGLLWSRFGTPTHRAGSGTQEEFEIAFEKHSRDNETVHILFYFKDKPVAPSQMDPEQLRLINSFRQKISDLGCLYGKFSEVDEFKSFARIHLGRLVQKYLALEPSPSEIPGIEPLSVSDSSLDSEDSVVEEEGFLDLIEEATDEMGRVQEIAVGMGEAVDELGNKMNMRTSELLELKGDGKTYDLKLAKRITGKAASDLDDYVARTETDIPIFSKSLSRAMATFGQAVSLRMDFDSEETSDLEENRVEVETMKNALISAKESMKGFRNTIARMPRITSAYNKSKRKAVLTLDSLLAVFESGIAQINEVGKTLDQLIEELRL